MKAGQSIIIYNTVYSGQLYTVTCSIINIISLFRSVCLRAAIMLYSCWRTIGSKVYMFGGNCTTVTTMIDLFMMDTLSDKWSQMEYSNSSSTSPMKKLGHGMMSITNNKKECLLVIGGYGPTPTSTTPNAECIPNPIYKT